MGLLSACADDPVSQGPPGDFGGLGTSGNGSLPAGGAAVGQGGSTGGSLSAKGGTSSLTGGAAPGGALTGGNPASGGTGGSKGGSGGAATLGGSGGKSGSGSGGSGGASTSGGKASGGSGGGGSVTLMQVGSIINTQCSRCHTATMPQLQNNAMLRSTLTTFKVPDCMNLPLVTPSDVSKSAIVMLVSKQCGATVMPLGCSKSVCIPDADLATLKSWIGAGAP
jgi:hypothetical protein